MSTIPTAKEAITKARNEIAREKFDSAVKKLKTKLRELDAAQIVAANIEREIDDLEQAIEQGNA